MTTAGAAGNKVVVRHADHRLLKGTTSNFYPDRPEFHVRPPEPGAAPVKIHIGELKAVFFVRTFEGDPSHVGPFECSDLKGQGRKIEITFHDGETLIGFTIGYNKTKPGFFVLPADTESNNERIFVVNTAVKEIRWL